MADGDEKPKKMKPEHLSIAAIAFAVISGGGGLGLNMSSNKEVVSKLETLTLTMVEFKGSIKASDERNSRIEVRLEKTDMVSEKLKDELETLKQKVMLLEAKSK